MKSQGSSQSMQWLGHIIETEPDTLHALPISCLCELLLAAENNQPTTPTTPTTSTTSTISTTSTTSTTSTNFQFGQATRVISRLWEYFGDVSSAPTLEVLQYFLQRISSR
jgi:hypothetical protein